MDIKTRNKRSTEFSTASMSDLVFLLLIFFVLLSTLVSPNAIKIMLPSSKSDRQMVEHVKITVYIDENFQYYLEDVPVDQAGLAQGLTDALYGETEGSVILKSDATVPIQFAVNIIDIVNAINKKYNAHHKVILATKPLE